MDDWLFSLVLISSALAAGAVSYFIVVLLVKHWNKLPILGGIKIKAEWLKGPLRLLIPVTFLTLGSPFLRFQPGLQAAFFHLINLLLIAATSWLLIRIIHITRNLILNRHDISVKDNLQARQVYTQIRVVERILIIVIILFALSFMLMSFPKVRQMGVSLLASAGVIGIILGFAAQKTLGNLIAGIQIAIAQPIRLDDVVIVENEWGWIEEINLMYVVVRIWDLRRLVVPISYFLEHPFQNWTRTSADILGTVFIYADYTVPLQEVRRELTRILEDSAYWDKKVNGLQVTNTSERTVEIRALMSAADSPGAWNLRCEVREKLLEFLQKKHPDCLPRTRIELNKNHT